MNLLGGMERMGYVEWLHKGHGLGLCISLVVSHPGTKGFGGQVLRKLTVQPLGNMGSAMII